MLCVRRHIGIRFIKLAHELEEFFNQKVDLVSRRAIKIKYLPFVEKSLIHVRRTHSLSELTSHSATFILLSTRGNKRFQDYYNT
jgi:hypothetical protein